MANKNTTSNKEKARLESEGKVKKYFFKEEKELGFKKRTYFVPGINKKIIVEAGKETTFEIYNAMPAAAREIFLTEKEVEELEKVEKEDK